MVPCRIFGTIDPLVRMIARHHENGPERGCLHARRLLEVAAREPEPPIGTPLTMTGGAKPLHRKCANYAAPFYEYAKAFYASSPVIKGGFSQAAK
jgi:hypothetical protein